MEYIDREVADMRAKYHKHIEERVNERRRSKPPYRIGDYVFYQRPRQIGGAKLESPWLGPYRVVSRVGVNSYCIYVPNEHAPLEAHATQLKFCHDDPPEEPIRFKLQVPPEDDQTASGDEGEVAT